MRIRRGFASFRGMLEVVLDNRVAASNIGDDCRGTRIGMLERASSGFLGTLPLPRLQEAYSLRAQDDTSLAFDLVKNRWM